MFAIMMIYCVLVYSSEAQSLTCDDTTGVCPGAELTCTCSVSSPVLVWNLPGPVIIAFTGGDDVGSIETGVNGVFFAKVTAASSGGKKSLLRYNATESFVNATIECENLGSGGTNSTNITVTFSDPPSAPGSLSVQSTTYNSATIQWTAPSNNGGSDITGYNITISPPPSGDSTCPLGSCTTVSPDTLMYNITGLDHTIDYNISVAAINCAGTGDGTITSGVVISGLTPDTQYSVTNMYDNIMYSLQSSQSFSSIFPTLNISSVTPSNTGTPNTPEEPPTIFIIIVVVVVVVVVVILLVAVVIIGICIKVKSGAKKGDNDNALKERDEPEALVERPVPETGQSGPMYQDPNTIERQQAPTGDLYAVPDRSKKSVKRDPPPAASNELATYQDPSTIQHEMAPTGDMYAMPDRKQQPAGGRPLTPM